MPVEINILDKTLIALFRKTECPGCLFFKNGQCSKGVPDEDFVLRKAINKGRIECPSKPR